MTAREISEKVIKAYVNKERKSSNKNVIEVNMFNLYDENEKLLSKYFKNRDDFALTVYRFGYYKMEITGYQKEVTVHGAIMLKGSDKYVQTITFIAKPCKEFESLNKYIANTLKCEALKIKDVYTENVAGKRSVIFERYNTTLLAHDPELCKEYKSRLIKMRKSNWKANIVFKSSKYTGDRFNSYREDRECEWNGSESHYAVVKFTTAAGKAVGELIMRVL